MKDPGSNLSNNPPTQSELNRHRQALLGGLTGSILLTMFRDQVPLLAKRAVVLNQALSNASLQFRFEQLIRQIDEE